jgi:probable rRNA maturation factor
MGEPCDSSSARPQAVAARTWLSLEVVRDRGDWSQFEPVDELIAAAAAALARHQRFRKEKPAEACVALSDDLMVRELNARYRGKDSATNVLSFPSHKRTLPGCVRQLGDVVIAQETVAREAATFAIAPAHHLQHLVVHGLLHLLGFDHEQDADADNMERLEAEILAALGLANPYAAACAAS